MPLLASEVMDEAAKVYLNDGARIRWPDSVLLPFLRSAVGEMQSELESNDLPPLYEIATIISVPKNTTLLNVPQDFVFPVYLDERAPNEPHFMEMTEVTWDPDVDRNDKLRYWNFREGVINLLGALTDREVRLRYLRSLSAVVTENSIIEVANAKGFYAARTAGLASSFGGSATQRGTLANERAEYFKRLVIAAITKRLQDRPVRRRRYQWRQR